MLSSNLGVTTSFMISTSLTVILSTVTSFDADLVVTSNGPLTVQPCLKRTA